jgi:hypothetical protein
MNSEKITPLPDNFDAILAGYKSKKDSPTFPQMLVDLKRMTTKHGDQHRNIVFQGLWTAEDVQELLDYLEN